jgi:hypothetical protein
VNPYRSCNSPEKQTVFLTLSDWSFHPGGRYRKEGKNSGEEYRDDILLPILLRGDDVSIDIDGDVYFTHSFLDECFGGLAHILGDEFYNRVSIKNIGRTSRGMRIQMIVNQIIEDNKKASSL